VSNEIWCLEKFCFSPYETLIGMVVLSTTTGLPSGNVSVCYDLLI
jgi:hypothetical protein